MKQRVKSTRIINRHLIGFFRDSNGFGIKVEHHGDKNNKKYLFKWHLVRDDGNFGSKLYEQIIDLS
nr:hypothetical protein [Mycoplasmopsis bovis]